MTMTGDTDVFALLAVAQANWPHDPVAGSEAVWRKWRELLGSFSFDEVRAALDGLVRDHRTMPPLAELLGELTRRRRAATSRIAAREEWRAEGGCSGWLPPVDLPDDYVIGPCSAAFAAMNGDGWTTERLIECIRMGRALACGEAASFESGHEAPVDPPAPRSSGAIDPTRCHERRVGGGLGTQPGERSSPWALSA